MIMFDWAFLSAGIGFSLSFAVLVLYLYLVDRPLEELDPGSSFLELLPSFCEVVSEEPACKG